MQPTSQSNNNPRIGVGVIVRRNGKILLGRRKNSHGEGHWAFPGGHLEFGETPEQCAHREVMEETGLTLENLQPGPYTNDIFEVEQKHYITLFMVADSVTGEPERKEPEKCLEWLWHDWNALPEPLFLPVINLKQQNYSPF
ncbi:nucleotide triphosphate diphosphatase NUDT15 [Endozoicomonadaceae bacterium StTr2]